MPHGGIIQNSGDYKIEMVQRENNISFYVLDAKGKTVSNKKITGSVVFEFFNKTKVTNPVSLDMVDFSEIMKKQLLQL
ncbi:hypothetical protein [Flavobacterium urumqiense]|uniref:Uncharacterized protein n=1 Tax=Flavobacterium urumqiense TaxID=935224 RepID=A0A1H5YS12_9FLAO|nr:hypothetical protein [Flavobacterium urumqiense]SEG26600.1 hypothetical protein SAMN04488130_108132 [Flavobacterium urumqiense]